MKNRELFFLGLAMLGGTVLMTASTFHLQNYYINTLFVGNSLAYLLGFLIPTISLLVGAFAYSISGHLSDNLKTKFGKRRPFFFIAIPCGIAFIFTTLPTFIQNILGFPTNFYIGFIFLIVIYVIYIFSWRFVQCPFLALFVDVTEPEERLKASVWLNLCDLGGVVIGVLLPLLFPIFGIVNGLEISIFIFGVIYIMAFMFAFILGPKENVEEMINEKTEEKQGFLSSVKEILKIPVFRNYIISAFFFVFCFNTAFNYIMPYLDFLEIPTSELIFYAMPLFIFAIVLFFGFSKVSKKWGKIRTFKISLLWGAIGSPFLLIIGITNIGPLTIIYQLMIVFMVLAGGIIGLLIFQYAVMMDLGKMIPKKESTFVGIYLSIVVFSGPLATFVLGLLTQYFNPINFWIWNGNLGFGLVGPVIAIAFLISFIFMRKIKYEEKNFEEKKVGEEK